MGIRLAALRLVLIRTKCAGIKTQEKRASAASCELAGLSRKDERKRSGGTQRRDNVRRFGVTGDFASQAKLLCGA